MLMKLLALLSYLAISGSVAASFDMMYIPDAGGSIVHRFDPVNRVYLGSINAPSRMASGNNSSSRLAVCETGSLPYFVNGYTGEFQTSTTGASAQTIHLKAAGNELLASSGAVLRRYDPVSAALISSAGVSGTMFAQSIAEIGGSRIAVLGTTANGITLQTYSSTLGFLSETLLISSANAASSAALSSMAFVTLGGASHVVFTYRNSSNQVSLARVAMTGGITPGATSQEVLSGFSTTSALTTTSVMAGHGGSFFIVGQGTTSTISRVIQGYIVPGIATFTTQNYTTTAFVAPVGGYWSGSNVVAPEPGSMIAIGAGILGLLRRRRKG